MTASEWLATLLSELALSRSIKERCGAVLDEWIRFSDTGQALVADAP